MVPAKTPAMVTTESLAAAFSEYYSDAGLTATPVSTVTVRVTNAGRRADDVVVQVFATRESPPPPGALPSPLRQLAGFTRAAALAPGESRAVVVDLAPLPFCVVDSSGNQWAEPATWRLAATVDGATMLNSTLVVSGARRSVLAWPTNSDTASSGPNVKTDDTDRNTLPFEDKMPDFSVRAAAALFSWLHLEKV